jgi:glutathione synthase
LVNELSKELPIYSTTQLALAAARRGHEVMYLELGDFCHSPSGLAGVHVRRLAEGRYLTGEDVVRAARAAPPESADHHDIDVLFLRYDPAGEIQNRPWAQFAGVQFAQLFSRQGVLVLNDPFTLSNAVSKLYFEGFPAWVRPRTLISRDRDEIKAFIREQGNGAVLKPLQGSGGCNVFLVERGSRNVNQIMDVISRDGYIVAQEFLQRASTDTRVILMDGQPLECEGYICAMHRIGAADDLRSNLHAGGYVEPCELTSEELAIVEAVRPKLLADGLFLVGLDIADGKLMEVNTFSPGGLGCGEMLHGVNFSGAVIEAIERKLRLHRRRHGEPTKRAETRAQL